MTVTPPTPAEVAARLAPGPARPQSKPPAVLDELIATVLSQHTSDRNSERAFAELKRRFPDWEEVLRADPVQLADAIRSGGMAHRKATTIQALLAAIQEREGRLDLERLRSLEDGAASVYLATLPGVGPKTAACVLLFAMGRSVLPVDTHVHRVATRLGWLPTGVSAERAHRLLADAVPRRLRRQLHLALVAHGRLVCRARRPRCQGCVLRGLCPSASGPVR